MDEKESIKKVLSEIDAEAQKLKRPVKFMEVCGTHTMVISQSGLRSLLPPNVGLISGPGCPACVTPQRMVNAAVELAGQGLQVATFGDTLGLPGSGGSLADARAEGAKVKVVESPMDALDCDVFFAIGFDTTAPNTAVAVEEGLIILNTHKRFLPAMKCLLELGEVRIDGFIDPGHVSTIIGSDAYRILGVPQVVSGFTPLDVAASVLLLLRQVNSGRRETVNEYRRAVKAEGNLKAKEVLDRVFTVGDSEWRGLGVIKDSGYVLKKKYVSQDAEHKYENILAGVSDDVPNRGCICSEVLRGLKKPNMCPLFAKTCTPANPQGACMVSSEGSCNICFRYGGYGD